MPFSQGHMPVQVQIQGNLSHFSVHASKSSLIRLSACFFSTHRDVSCVPTRMEPSREQTMEVHTPHTPVLGFWCFRVFYGVQVTGKFKRREHTERVMLVFVVCAASIRHPCQSVFYDCVYVYEGADQDAYSARPVRSLLVGFIGRSGWWRL